MQMSYDDVAKSLVAAGVPVVRERLVADVGAAVAAVEGLACPVVLKLVSPELVHKSDVGAVLLDVRGPDAARAGAERLAALAADLSIDDDAWRILVQELVVPTAVEVFIGLKRDAVFGPIVVVGAGGKFVELLGDKVIAACPVTETGAATLLRGTVLGALLGGYRGGPDVVDDVAAVVAAASRLPDVVPDLVEADLNPVVATERGPVVVDARIAVFDEPLPVLDTSPVRTWRDLDPLLEPRSVAVIGASASVVLPGNRVLGYLRTHEYPGRVVVVHPTAPEVDGFPTVPTLTDAGADGVDLACVAVAADRCPEVMEQCGEAGVRAAVVLSSGFSEVGDDALEARLVEVAERHGIILCGPNTVGVMSPGSRVHVSFSQAQDMLHIPTGGVAVVTQSGALGGSIASQAWERGIGISRFVSVGNQAALTVADYLDHLAGDDATEAIAVVLDTLAEAGQSIAPAGSGAVVQLTAQRARAAARLGDSASVRAALDRAGRLVDRQPGDRPRDHHFAFDGRKLHRYRVVLGGRSGGGAAGAGSGRRLPDRRAAPSPRHRAPGPGVDPGPGPATGRSRPARRAGRPLRTR